MKLNIATQHTGRTFEGAPSVPIKPLVELRRAVSGCLLWEDQFYESGLEIAKRIEGLCALAQISPEEISSLALKARQELGLRHVPLLLVSELSKRRPLPNRVLQRTVEGVVRRADELSELLAVFWREGKRPIPAQMKRGLAEAFGKFDSYALGKYNRDAAIKLRDVLFMVHPKPKDETQAVLWKQLVDGTLQAPDTWEVALSSGADKKATWERLLAEQKLGYLALLRNLRNMEQAGVDRGAIAAALAQGRGAQMVWPFRYIAAARAAPGFAREVNAALLERVGLMTKLQGLTRVLVDVSGSMNNKLSGKSDLTRMDAAAALGAVVPCERKEVFSFSTRLVQVAAWDGLPGVEAIVRSQPHGGTALGQAVAAMNELQRIHPADRLIVVTDEQADGPVPDFLGPKAYMVNVASYRNAVGYGPWVRVDGWSEGVLRFIEEHEREGL